MLYKIDKIKDGDWPEVINLISESIGNVVIVKLGKRFAELFYRSFSLQDYSCVYVARSNQGRIIGVIIGTLDHRRAYLQAVNNQRLRLFLSANIHLLSIPFIAWLLNGIMCRLKKKPHEKPCQLKARLVVIAVCGEFRGSGLANSLVTQMEKFLFEHGLREEYLILTEKNNSVANRFYEKIGAVFSTTYIHHGRTINEWHKSITDRNFYE